METQTHSVFVKRLVPAAILMDFVVTVALGIFVDVIKWHLQPPPLSVETRESLLSRSTRIWSGLTGLSCVGPATFADATSIPPYVSVRCSGAGRLARAGHLTASKGQLRRMKGPCPLRSIGVMHGRGSLRLAIK